MDFQDDSDMDNGGILSSTPISVPLKTLESLEGSGSRKGPYILVGVAIFIILVAVNLFYFSLGEENYFLIKQRGNCSGVEFELLNCSYIKDGLEYKTTVNFLGTNNTNRKIKDLIVFLNFESRTPKFEKVDFIPDVGLNGEKIISSNKEPINSYLLISFVSQIKNCKSSPIFCSEIILTNNTIISDTNTNNNAPLVADAGSNEDVEEGFLVVLDGSGSFDPDGEDLTYFWEQISGISVSLDDENIMAPSFTAPLVDSEERLIFELIVNNGIEDSNPDEVRIYVQNIEEVIEGPINSIPSLPPSLI